MANVVTLSTAIMAFMSLAGAMSSTDSPPSATNIASFTVQHAEVIPTLPAALKAVPTNELPANPTVICNDHCYGVNRADIVDAVNHYCDTYGEWTYPTDGEETELDWDYNCTLEGTGTRHVGGDYEEGRIKVSIAQIQTLQCNPPIQMNRDACYKYLMRPVDTCNYETENGKQGGYYESGCLLYWVNPNPYWWPNCRLGTCGDSEKSCYPTMAIPGTG